jgi:hypothetical protein
MGGVVTEGVHFEMEAHVLGFGNQLQALLDFTYHLLPVFHLHGEGSLTT